MNKQASSNPEFAFLIAFASRETADEWWRMISTPYSGIVERISPQLYLQSKPSGALNVFPSRISKKVFITSLNPKTHRKTPIILPPVTITDHISGGW